MQAAISGLQGIAILIDDSKLNLIDISNPSVVNACSRSFASNFLSRSVDCVFVENVSIEAVTKQLEASWEAHAVIHLISIINDATADDELRADAIEELNEIATASPDAVEFAERYLFSVPTQIELSRLSDKTPESVKAILSRIQSVQPAIALVLEAIEGSLASELQDSTDRAAALATLIREGVVHRFVLAVNQSANTSNVLAFASTLPAVGQDMRPILSRIQSSLKEIEPAVVGQRTVLIDRVEKFIPIPQLEGPTDKGPLFGGGRDTLVMSKPTITVPDACQLTTRQVAVVLNVSESSVKRWCDRGAIPTVRTLGGHRRIPLDGFLRFLEETNREVLFPRLKEPSSRESPVLRGRSILETLLPQFEIAVIEGNELKCLTLLTQYYSLNTSFAKVADDFIAATFRRLGELRDCGSLEIYQERRGYEICHSVLHDFRRLIPEAPATAPIAIGGSPAGDQHTLPNQLIELVLQECSWRASNLGPNLPFETIASAVSTHQPKLLWLSVSHLEDEDSFVQSYGKFQSHLPAQTMVVLGGGALHGNLRPRLKYTGHCDNMQQFAAFASAVRGNPQYIKSSSDHN